MCLPRMSGCHCSSAAPSRRTRPRAGAQAPMTTRTSEDLPAPLGPMTPRALPAFSVKLTSTTDGRFEPGGTTARFSTLSVDFGAGSGIGSSVVRELGEQAVEAAPGLAARDEALPVGDQHLDRLQRTGAEDRGGDDHAERGVVDDDEIGAEAEQERLEHHAEDFADARIGAGALHHRLVARLVGAVDRRPSARRAGCPCRGRGAPRRSAGRPRSRRSARCSWPRRPRSPSAPSRR